MEVDQILVSFSHSSNSEFFLSEKINFKLSNSFFLFITKFGFIPTLFVIMVLAIISPSLSIMLDLNSFVIKFVLNVFFVNELRNTALIEKITGTYLDIHHRFLLVNIILSQQYNSDN